MREKRGVKATVVGCSDISITKKETPVINGYYHEETSKKSTVVSKAVNKREIKEKWTAMDYNKYFLRNNGTASKCDLMSVTDSAVLSTENLSTSNSDDSPYSEKPPGHVFGFYKKFAPDYWNIFPKTDYTYSPTSQYYKKEIAPGIPVVPNLSRRPLRYSYGSPSSPTLSSPKTSEEDSSTSTTTFDHIVVRKRNASIYKRNNWHRTSWIRRTFETIKTVIITSITTSVTTTTEALMHPMKKPCITFPILFLLLALLFYILLYSENEVVSNDPIPWMPLTWLQAHSSDTSFLATLGSTLCKPFIWTYKVFLHLFTTCLFMIPSVLSQLVQLLNNSFLIFIQKLFGLASSNAVAGALDGGIEFSKTTEKSSILDSSEIRKIVLDILSERDKEDTRNLSEMKISANDQVKVLNDFILKVNEKLSSLENLSNEQKKALDDIYPQLKVLGERLSTVQFNSAQTAEVANRESSSNATSIAGIQEDVALVVKSMLKQYHADRTGRPDYALMSNGGTIISIRCTQTYTKESGNIYLFGFPIWNVHSSPEVIIQPGIMPGECWAFEGSEGYVAISLAMPVYITGFTLEHTPKELTPHGNIKSAPHQFSVWALKEVMDENPRFLGRFKFLDNGESLQYFDAEKLDVPVHMVELRIESNHGSINYTCLYRFRVHGIPA